MRIHNEISKKKLRYQIMINDFHYFSTWKFAIRSEIIFKYCIRANASSAVSDFYLLQQKKYHSLQLT